jgi:hypothetical protein
MDPVAPARQFRKPKADVYTMMLVASLIAIILAIVCLYAEMKDYDFDFKSAPRPASAPAVETQSMVAHNTEYLRFSVTSSAISGRRFMPAIS